MRCANFSTALRQELAGGEREELAFTRGDGRAEQPDPQREVLRERRGAGDARAEDAPDGDLGERQDHDPAERERGQNVLGASRGPLHYLPLDLRNASRSCRAMS